PLLLGAVGDGVREEDAGVVEQDVKPLEDLQRLVDGAPAVVGQAHVGADEDPLRARALDLVQDDAPAHLVPPDQGDLRPLARAQHGRRPADPGRSPRDQGYLSRQAPLRSPLPPPPRPVPTPQPAPDPPAMTT